MCVDVGSDVETGEGSWNRKHFLVLHLHSGHTRAHSPSKICDDIETEGERGQALVLSVVSLQFLLLFIVRLHGRAGQRAVHADLRRIVLCVPRWIGKIYCTYVRPYRTAVLYRSCTFSKFIST